MKITWNRKYFILLGDTVVGQGLESVLVFGQIYILSRRQITGLQKSMPANNDTQNLPLAPTGLFPACIFDVILMLKLITKLIIMLILNFLFVGKGAMRRLQKFNKHYLF